MVRGGHLVQQLLHQYAATAVSFWIPCTSNLPGSARTLTYPTSQVLREHTGHYYMLCMSHFPTVLHVMYVTLHDITLHNYMLGMSHYPIVLLYKCIVFTTCTVFDLTPDTVPYHTVPYHPAGSCSL